MTLLTVVAVAGIEERMGIENEQAKGGEAEAVEAPAIAIEKAADEIERQHGEGTLHRLAEAGEQSVREG